MAAITFDKVSKVYADGTRAVSSVDLEIADGSFMVLVGPSGCGKTTLLRMVAGLEGISEGTIRVGGRVVNNVPPKERDIAMVFQNYALYPGREAAGADACRDRAHPARSRRDDRVRDARPDRGDDPRRPRRRPAGRPAPAGRLAAGALRAAAEPVRGGIHRLTGDEPRR